MQKIPTQCFRLLTGELLLGQHRSRDFSKHYFCTRCGIQCFTRITSTTENLVAVNVGFLEGANLEALPPRLFDGANIF